ncbi:hypothetical protein F5B20DRAFT_592583 [Whalleya microplaca]|nr:hypothetical protein F5B20DRAFT_592583 [Whalleya microplaca]
MKAGTLAAALAPCSLTSAEWYDGAPECAQSCLSSAYSPTGSGTISSWWPAQSTYCDSDAGSSIGACLSAACSDTPTAYASYADLSTSLCSRYASCTAAGSTGVQTITYPSGPVTWAAPGGWSSASISVSGSFSTEGVQGTQGSQVFSGSGSNQAQATEQAQAQAQGGSKALTVGGGKQPPWDAQQWGGPNDSAVASQYWSEWAAASTWSGGVVTVTGCAFDGSPWFVGPRCGWNDAGGFNGWIGWGEGWSWGPTSTQTVTFTTTDSAGAGFTGTGLATVAMAVSGTLTTSTTLGAIATSTEGKEENAAAPGMMGSEGGIVTGLMAFGLGAVVVVAAGTNVEEVMDSKWLSQTTGVLSLGEDESDERKA